jgi:hypothetical protein
MDNLIKYRNDRKNEGASAADLKLIDERITTLLRAAEKPKWICEVLPALGMATVKVIDGTDSIMRSAVPYEVSVNLSTETVGDLAKKACSMSGIGFLGVKLVNGGKHLDAASSLRSTWIRDGSLVAICNRIGCDEHCAAVGLCQPAFVRDDPQMAALLALWQATAAEPLPREWACEALLKPKADLPIARAPSRTIKKVFAQEGPFLEALPAAAAVPVAVPVAETPVLSDEDLYG